MRLAALYARRSTAVAMTAALLTLSATTARADTRTGRAIHHAAVMFGVSERDMRAVAYCESRDDAGAVNQQAVGGERSSGLFQFLPSTWSRLPRWISRHSIFDPWWNAIGAAWLVTRDGGWWEWSCRP